MKFLVVLALAVACASADVLTGEAAAPIVRSSFDNTPEGNFKYGYETSNKITAEAEGVIKNLNSDYPTLEVKGGYAYVAPDGTPVDTTYVANEFGYQPQGSHIPKVPEYIARAIQYIEAHPPPAEPIRKY